ncbi:hypothetical protein [uncultured Methanobrevibacter sp.]|uniref:hypothetical protein n=1 Tax=uncultured Methanobrevibacter sp. TaxID=253161 RepID=UPI00261ADD68|nr:hypothetical protein [uncultured Methanobrevibacter sp.]
MYSNKEVKEILQRCITAIDYMDKVSHLPNCNDCAIYHVCSHAPRLGEQVRINCPLHRERI